MRLVSVVTQGTDADVSWNWVNQAIWATVEADLAIVSGMCSLFAEEISPDSNCIKACLPTLRPVWITVRRKFFGSQPADQPADQPARATSLKRTHAPSWATRILKSNTDESEDTQPFSTTSSHMEEGLHHHSTFDRSRTKMTVAIPLSSLKKQANNDTEGITVNTAWDVEYNRHSPLNGP